MAGLLVVFMLLALLLLVPNLGGFFYVSLVFFSIVFLAFELVIDAGGKSFLRAAFVGVFLMVFDFAVESAGGVAGLWVTRGSVFQAGYVPVEIMLVCLLGGTAWALYLPKNFNLKYGVFDVLFFSSFGVFGESLMRGANLMSYSGGWTVAHAFLGYAFTWMMLHVLRYKVLEV